MCISLLQEMGKLWTRWNFWDKKGSLRLPFLFFLEFCTWAEGGYSASERGALPPLAAIESASVFRSVSVSDGPLLYGQKWGKTARGHPWHPVVFRCWLVCASAGKQNFGSCGTVPDSSRSSSPVGPRTARETDLLVCAAEFVCGLWCSGMLWISLTGLRSTTARLRRSSSAALAEKFRCLSFRGPAGELTEDTSRWENSLTNTSSYCDATHEPRSEREVRNHTPRSPRSIAPVAYATNMPLACLFNAAGFRRSFGYFSIA